MLEFGVGDWIVEMLGVWGRVGKLGLGIVDLVEVFLVVYGVWRCVAEGRYCGKVVGEKGGLVLGMSSGRAVVASDGGKDIRGSGGGSREFLEVFPYVAGGCCSGEGAAGISPRFALGVADSIIQGLPVGSVFLN